jgi:putative transposase
MRKLYRHLDRGTARILSATVSQVGGNFFIAFTVKIDRAIRATRSPDKIIGIDAGLTTLYTGATPDGEQVLRVENPRHVITTEKKLAHAQRIASRRQGPRNGVYSSNRWKKANCRVQKIHANNQRSS